jgi:hypothetical protein
VRKAFVILFVILVAAGVYVAFNGLPIKHKDDAKGKAANLAMDACVKTHNSFINGFFYDTDTNSVNAAAVIAARAAALDPSWNTLNTRFHELSNAFGDNIQTTAASMKAECDKAAAASGRSFPTGNQ